MKKAILEQCVYYIKYIKYTLHVQHIKILHFLERKSMHKQLTKICAKSLIAVISRGIEIRRDFSFINVYIFKMFLKGAYELFIIFP